jgi:acyl-CoA synthetase (NDP forming)
VVEDLIELISSAKALAFQKPPEGRNVAVVSLVAGLGMVAADVCEETGLKLVEFTDETKEEIFKLLPPYTIRTNPVDLGFVANDPDVCGEVIKAVFRDENVQGVVLNYIYSWGDDFLKLPIDAIIDAVESSGKPITMCLKYPPGIWDREKEKLEENGVPTFPTPELAARAMAALAEYGEVKRK